MEVFHPTQINNLKNQPIETENRLETSIFGL